MVYCSSPEKAKVWSGKSGGNAERIEDADEDSTKGTEHGMVIRKVRVCCENEVQMESVYFYCWSSSYLIAAMRRSKSARESLFDLASSMLLCDGQ